MMQTLEAALKDAQRHERHRNHQETLYWFNQYKQLAINAVKEVKRLQAEIADLKGENAA